MANQVKWAGVTRMKTAFICTLPQQVQERIEERLRSLGLDREEIQRGMDGRLCDLEDTVCMDVNVDFFL